MSEASSPLATLADDDSELSSCTTNDENKDPEHNKLKRNSPLSTRFDTPTQQLTHSGDDTPKRFYSIQSPVPTSESTVVVASILNPVTGIKQELGEIKKQLSWLQNQVGRILQILSQRVETSD